MHRSTPLMKFHWIRKCMRGTLHIKGTSHFAPLPQPSNQIGAEVLNAGRTEITECSVITRRTSCWNHTTFCNHRMHIILESQYTFPLFTSYNNFPTVFQCLIRYRDVIAVLQKNSEKARERPFSPNTSLMIPFEPHLGAHLMHSLHFETFLTATDITS